MRKGMTWKMRTGVSGIGLAALMTVLSGCTHGQSTSAIEVTDEFLYCVARELPVVHEKTPCTASVVDDWIMQNEPNY